MTKLFGLIKRPEHQCNCTSNKIYAVGLSIKTSYIISKIIEISGRYNDEQFVIYCLNNLSPDKITLLISLNDNDLHSYIDQCKANFYGNGDDLLKYQ